MRVCYFGCFDEGYVRNRTLIEGLRRAGTEVSVCHASLWRDVGDRVTAAARPSAGLAWRIAAAQARLLRQYRTAPVHDVIVLGYPGQTDAVTARLCSRLSRRPLVLDAFISMYETAVEDRALMEPRSLLARGMKAVDKVSVGAADMVLLSTEQHADYFRSHVSVRQRYGVVPLSADDRFLSIPELPQARRTARLKVLYVGSYVPLHGIDTLLRAAHLLRDEPIDFELVGRGQHLAQAQSLAAELGLPAVSFDSRWHTEEEVAEHIAAADVCLGVFGTSDKAGRVVPIKLIEGLASARPTVTADTPAARALIADGTEALLCPPGDAAALAQALRRLDGDWTGALRMAAAGRELFRRRLSVDAAGRQFQDLLESL
ncbi:MAG: glycosyltransferase [Anaerolineae bacterium]